MDHSVLRLLLLIITIIIQAFDQDDFSVGTDLSRSIELVINDDMVYIIPLSLLKNTNVIIESFLLIVNLTNVML